MPAVHSACPGTHQVSAPRKHCWTHLNVAGAVRTSASTGAPASSSSDSEAITVAAMGTPKSLRVITIYLHSGIASQCLIQPHTYIHQCRTHHRLEPLDSQRDAHTSYRNGERKTYQNSAREPVDPTEGCFIQKKTEIAQNALELSNRSPFGSPCVRMLSLWLGYQHWDARVRCG